MRGFNDAAFTLLFNRLVSASNLHLDKDEWQVADVGFQRQRHSYWGHDYAFSVEIYTLRCVSRETWELMVVRENWWDGGGHAPVKSSQWGKLIGGRECRCTAEIRLWRMGQPGEHPDCACHSRGGRSAAEGVDGR